MFARQVEALGTAGDVAIGITTSGDVGERERGAGAARARGLRTIGLTGRDGGETGRLVDVHVNVPGATSAAGAGSAPHRAARDVRVDRERRMPELRSETMTVNMGPQHPSTHGVLRLVLELDGETIVSADPTIGFLHTGIEKTAEQKKWQQVIPLVERMDYLGPQSNSLAFCLSVERLHRPREHAGSRDLDPRAHRRAAAAVAATSCGSARTAWKSARSP